MSEVPNKAFEAEYYYQQTAQRQARDFAELIKRFSEDDSEVRQVLTKAHAEAAARDPSNILNPEAITKIKESQPEVFKKIVPIYRQFLAEKAGLV